MVDYNLEHFSDKICRYLIANENTYRGYSRPPGQVILEERIVDASLATEVLGLNHINDLVSLGLIVPCFFIGEIGTEGEKINGYIFPPNADGWYKKILDERRMANDFSEVL